jgi:ParB family transcriptional regulator, chromosome partitioning protein
MRTSSDTGSGANWGREPNASWTTEHPGTSAGGRRKAHEPDALGTKPVRRSLDAELIRRGDNDRTVFDPDELQILADSIGSVGISFPPLVRPRPDGTYEIVAGERRFRAMSQILGWKKVPVMVEDMDDARARSIMLVENMARADIDVIDEANAYDKRMREDGLTIDELSAASGVPRNRIEMRLKFLRIVPEGQSMLRAGSLRTGFAEILPVLDNERQRFALKALASAESMSFWQWSHMISRLEAEQNESPLFDPGDFEMAVEVYVAHGKSKVATPTEALRQAIEDLVAALEDAGIRPDLVERSRLLLKKGIKAA